MLPICGKGTEFRTNQDRSVREGYGMLSSDPVPCHEGVVESDVPEGSCIHGITGVSGVRQVRVQTHVIQSRKRERLHVCPPHDKEREQEGIVNEKRPPSGCDGDAAHLLHAKDDPLCEPIVRRTTQFRAHSPQSFVTLALGFDPDYECLDFSILRSELYQIFGILSRPPC